MLSSGTVTLGATPTALTSDTTLFATTQLMYSNLGNDYHYVGPSNLSDADPASNAYEAVLPGETKPIPLVGVKIVPGSVALSAIKVKGPTGERGAWYAQ